MSISTTEKNKAGKTWRVIRESVCAAQRLNSVTREELATMLTFAQRSEGVREQAIR